MGHPADYGFIEDPEDGDPLDALLLPESVHPGVIGPARRDVQDGGRRRR